jgi:AraC-like DNA-binding protein
MGLTPLSYIRALRFNAARKLLLSRESVQRSISEIAMDVGFTQLGQFAVDYRGFFGESPTATRSRVRRYAQHSGPARRPCSPTPVSVAC